MSTPYWPVIWKHSASEIINEQGLEERTQKSAHALSMLGAENTHAFLAGNKCIPVGSGACEIVNEQALKEAQKKASSEALSY